MIIIGQTKGLKKTMRNVRLVAKTDSSALILGETGAGKEMIARYIHEHSYRKKQPFIRVNCGAIPSELIDSELFGHEKGSFTGATHRKKGWFEQADDGVLFLDEIGELSLPAQVRLLRVLQEGTLTRVGSEQPINVDVRIIAATHRDLNKAVSQGRFREDLLFRINIFPIWLPPLRQRFIDLDDLCKHLSHKASTKLGLPVRFPTESQIEYLKQYDWPGNIRELQGIIERAAILGEGHYLAIEDSLVLSDPSPPHTSETHSPPTTQRDRPLTLDEVIRRHIVQTLNDCHGRIEGPFGAAKRLDVHPSTLRSKMKNLGIGRQSAHHDETNPVFPVGVSGVGSTTKR
ncbi:sigma-54 interaction domain-containing protein [Vibrio ouci]|uniref:Sigma-54-dependent Fis family transcriptional regulator n=1 Tax=Vibrio ouci TaxID=2499078 RepID=A0A4Y8WCD7_9VIBR|nr:sigma-54 dependent transcriptional regulator [Vibrio ouci]TFH90283.1 sigma-54-dependent Fis family transcriptional regulator [Vibrio ouci]